MLTTGGLVNDRVRNWLIGVVACVWAINFVAPVFNSAYKPTPELNIAFMAIIGVLTASYKRPDNGDDDDDKGGDR